MNTLNNLFDGQDLDRTYSDNLEKLIEKAAKPKIWLTVEEAKFLDRCCVFLSGFDKRYDVEGAKDFHRKLSKRIEQAEKCDA